MKKLITGMLASGALVAGAFICGWLLTRQSQAPGDRPPSTRADAIQSQSAPADPWAQLLEDLASSEPAVHARGIMTLNSATTLEREALRVLAGKATEPAVAEVKRRLAELDEEAALDPPPISLRVKDATLSEVTFALSKATGETINFPSMATEDPGGFTLAAKDEPFWKVIGELNRQHPLCPIHDPMGLALRSGPPGGTQDVAIANVPDFASSHGMVAFATGTRRKMNPLSSYQLAPDEIALTYALVADPRLRIIDVQFNAPELQADGATVQITRIIATGGVMGKIAGVWEPTLFVRLTEQNAGKKAVLKSSVLVSVVVRDVAVEVMEPEKHLRERIAVGDVTVTLSSFTVTDQSIRYFFNQSPQYANTSMTIFDAEGRRIGRMINTGAAVGAGASGPFVPPLRARFSVPTKMINVTVPIEIRDIALPPLNP